jgi:2-desacetyl-2-hydroxyethyl bacteriochlorophyllide A dehydrogenase
VRAMVFTGVGQPFTLQELPNPQIGPGDVLVRVKAAGICGSDVHIAIEGTTKPSRMPIVLGHEAAGIIEAMGSDVSGWHLMDRVAILPDVVCGRCVNCWGGRSELCVNRQLIGIQRDGALAEYVAVPARNLVRLPDGISFEAGAIATDAAATPYHALVRVGGLHAGERVLVTGLGALGLHCVALARAVGAAWIAAVTRHPRVAQRARARGADVVCSSPLSLAANGEYDLAVDFSGDPNLIEEAIGMLRPGGRVVLVGISEKPLSTTHVPISTLVRQGIAIIGSYGAHPGDLSEVLALAEGGRINLENSVTHRFALPDAYLALQHLTDKLGDPIRIAIVPGLEQSTPSLLCRQRLA